MGQKVNPVGFRIGVNHAWGSRWFAPKKTFGAYLIEDQQIREVCKKKLAEAGISRILIERYANRVRVTLFSARPGVIIGHKGGDVEAIRAQLEKDGVVVLEDTDPIYIPLSISWDRSKKYIYTIEFNGTSALTPITFSVAAEDWTDADPQPAQLDM